MNKRDIITTRTNFQDSMQINPIGKAMVRFPEDLDKLYPFNQETQSHLVKAQVSKLFCFYSCTLFKASKKMQKVFSEEKLYTAVLQYQFYLDGCRSFADYKNPKFVHKLLVNSVFLLLAYVKLKSSLAFWPEKVLNENLTLNEISKLSIELKNESYICLPVRCVYISQSKVNQKQFFGLSSVKDKMIQQALKMLLEPLFDPRFYNASCGFRPGKNCHTCLRQIFLKGRDVTWFIEIGLGQMLNKTNQQLFIWEVKSILKDFKVINLLCKLLGVGYLNVTKLTDSKIELDKKILPRWILSPFVANVFFHRLDRFVLHQILPKFSESKKSIYNCRMQYWKVIQYCTIKSWRKLHFEAKRLAPNVSFKKIKKSFLEIRKQEAIHKRMFFKTSSSNNLWYYRYVDDVLFGFCGSKKDARRVLQYLALAVEWELCMSLDTQTSAVRHHSEGVVFLGYKLLGNSKLKYRWDITRKNMSVVNNITFSIPTFRLLNRLKEEGFVQKGKKKKNVKFVARKVDKWLFLPSDYMVLQKFNVVTKSLANYYSGLFRFTLLVDIYCLLRRSAALTLAYRHNKRTAKWAFNKWGKELTVTKVTLEKGKKQLKSIRFFFPLKKNYKIFGKWKMDKDQTGVLENLLNILSAKRTCEKLW
jgi:retron-type reverse transcriptase